MEIQNGGTAVYPIKFTEDKTRSYIEMNLNNKRCFWDVFFGDNITIDQKTDIKNYLKENKYRTITW